MITSVRLEARDDVSVLHMEAGENRFSLAFAQALLAAVAEAESKGAPIVLTGSGKFFSNGLDVAWIGENAGQVDAMMKTLHTLYGRLLLARVGTVAAVNGHAFGAGAMLAAACDVRIMRGDRGYFCFPEVDLGLTLSDGMLALCRSKLPRDSFHQALITGGRFGGADALRLGFVHAIAAESELLGAAVSAMKPLVGKDGSSLQALKRQVHLEAAAVLGA